VSVFPVVTAQDQSVAMHNNQHPLHIDEEVCRQVATRSQEFNDALSPVRRVAFIFAPPSLSRHCGIASHFLARTEGHITQRASNNCQIAQRHGFMHPSRLDNCSVLNRWHETKACIRSNSNCISFLRLKHGDGRTSAGSNSNELDLHS
jgi:hypothetical protein